MRENKRDQPTRADGGRTDPRAVWGQPRSSGLAVHGRDCVDKAGPRREEVGRSLRNCRSARRSSAKRQELPTTLRYSNSPQGVTVR